MKKQLLITSRKEKIVSSLFEEKELVQVNVEDRENTSLLGNIYVGKVKNIVKNIEAAFVEIADGQMCYLPLGKKEHPIFCNSKKNDKVCIGDEILVQVSKDAIKTKNPSVTTNLQFAGKYVILTHGKIMPGISGKITNEEERNRLKTVIKPYVSEKKGCGMIVRTNAEGIEEEKILLEAKTLYALYETICTKGIYKNCFSMLYQAPAGFLCDIRDGYDEELDQIITDDLNLYDQIEQYLSTYQKEDLDKLSLYEDEMISLNRLYGLETKLDKALQKKVWLKSGGYLVIEPTEALTVIDVNSGKAIAGKKDTEKHFLKINLEAAKEIAKQLRLRNLSGIILVDFIDMESKKSKQQLIQQLEADLKKDPVKAVYVDMTKLNLVEITRKKVRRPLHEQIRSV